MTPAAERKAAERQRRKDAGLVAVTVYVKPEDRQALRAYVKKINARKRYPSNEALAQQAEDAAIAYANMESARLADRQNKALTPQPPDGQR